MADRYDPKVTVRPATDRKGSDSHQGPAPNDDPLFELARIVSGRGAGASSAAGAPPPRGRPAPSPEPEPPEPANPAPREPDVLGDLEAELLSDLQASFAAVKEAIDPVQPEPPPAPKAPPPSPPPAAKAPPSSPPAAATSSTPYAPPTPHVPPAAPVRPPQAEATAPAASQPAAAPPAQPRVSAAAPPVQPRVSAAAAPPVQYAPPPRQTSAPAAPPPRERPATPPPAATAPAAPATPKKAEVGGLNLRPTTAPEPRASTSPPPDKPASAAAKPSRWDKPAEPPKAQAAANRFAPPRAANQPAPPPPRSQPAPPPAADEQPPFGEGLPFDHEDEETADEFPLDAFDIVPGYGDDAELPPYPEDDELEPLHKRGVPRSLVAIAGILALVLVGVLGFVMLRPGSSGDGTPPIITADASPTKIAPPEPPASGNGDQQQNKLIYDRVDSGASNTAPGNTKLVTPDSQPIAPVPSTDNSNNAIARVILPGGPASKTPGTADAGNTGDNAAANGGNEPQSIGPRKVRTVVVRPDGTIVSSDATPAPGNPPASTSTMPTPTPPTTTAKVPAVPPVPTNDDTAAIAGGKSGQELTITTNPGAAKSPTETPTPPATTTTRTPTPPQPKPTPSRTVATGSDTGPLDLTPGNGKSTTEVASLQPNGQGGALPLVAGGMMVQISSQRSQDAARATFRDLQTRYPSILGGYQANIQRADLGSRGIYFRVRVGPFTSANAKGLCSTLKNAGGDCILTRH